MISAVDGSCWVIFDIAVFLGIQDGSTALHLAVVTNHSDLVTSLIADGAHVDVIDGKGR